MLSNYFYTMKLSNLIILLLTVLMLNSCKTGITGQVTADPQDYNGLKQIIVPANQYSSDINFFDATKIHDRDITQIAWSGSGTELNKYIMLDAGEGKTYGFTGVKAYFYNGKNHIQYSDNGIDWISARSADNHNYEAYLTRGLSLGWYPYDDYKYFVNADGGFVGFHRYWRLVFTYNFDYGIETRGYELQWSVY